LSQITVTLDVEDHRPGPRAELRFPTVTRGILDWLGTVGARGTFFIVGEEAQRHPDLVADIAAGGHEVALHGHRHIPLPNLTPHELAADLAVGRDVLEQAGQCAVAGFRAPQFSLTAESVWAHEVISAAGFRYSSSVLPQASPLFGYPGAPYIPFRWPSGLIEIPATMLGSGRFRVPLGGVYFRLAPAALTRRLLGGSPATVKWIYLHPYDFDPGEKFYVVRDANPLASPLQWVNRRRVRARLVDLLGSSPGAPLGERIADLGELATYSG